ncbi:MAG: dihydroorotate dehydrogenase-like protein [Bacteroides sp.]|nr:dihydroorotate dehydrogenase-like protein [Bacteroides sp.]
MKNLETMYAGLKLKNPFVVSSCSLTNSAERNKKWEDAGAAAVILKSLFEEEIEAELVRDRQDAHAEEMDYLQTYYRAHRLEDYLQLIKDTKKVCTLPVIASINCYCSSDWTSFARYIEEAGADALELNIMSVSCGLDEAYGTYEQMHIDILKQVKSVLKIPVIMKLGRNFTNCIPLVDQLYANGAAAVVLFNRMVTFDINIEKLSYAQGNALGQSNDLSEVLRWAGLVSARVPHLDIAASGGVADGASLVKALLAGASVAEVCSALYWNGTGCVQDMLHFLEEWMDRHDYESISQFRGLLNARKDNALDMYERSQFFKSYSRRND